MRPVIALGRMVSDDGMMTSRVEQPNERRTSYSGVLVMAISLATLIVALTAWAPALHLTRQWYLYLAAIGSVAFFPIFFVTDRRMFRFAAITLLVGWLILIVVPSLGYGGGGVLLLLPIPTIVAWLLPPAPPDGTTALIIAGGLVVAGSAIAVGTLLIPTHGDTVYLCHDEWPDAQTLQETFGTPHPQSGYSLPDGVRSVGGGPNQTTYRFDPFTGSQVQAFISKAETVPWVTGVNLNIPCPSSP